MHKPFFSIIIPTYNEEEYLPRLLENLLTQKEKDFEVIVVDSLSADNTSKVVRDYQKNLPLKFIEVKSRNVSQQRNIGVEVARGEYLIFFDADVQIGVDYLEKIKQYLTQTGAPFVTSYVKADSQHPLDKAIAQMINRTMEVSLFIERPFAGGYCFIIARQAFHLVGGFDPQIKLAEDYDLSQRLHTAGYRMKILSTPKIIFSLRRYRHEGRLKVLRQQAQASIHIFTKGSITKAIFDYPMGGGWYKEVKQKAIKKQAYLQFRQAEKYVKNFLRVLLE